VRGGQGLAEIGGFFVVGGHWAGVGASPVLMLFAFVVLSSDWIVALGMA
jgi:hypothetical protein